MRVLLWLPCEHLTDRTHSVRARIAQARAMSSKAYEPSMWAQPRFHEQRAAGLSSEDHSAS